jgi:transposase-like protein
MFFVGIYQKVSQLALSQFDYVVGDLKRRQLLKRSKENIEDCRTQLAAIESDPRASEQHKTELRRHLEALEKAHFELRHKGSVQVTSA